MVDYNYQATDEAAASKPVSYNYQAGPSAGGKQGGKAPANLWNSILQGVAKRDDQQDSFLLLLGDTGVGKKTLLREIDNKLVNSRNKKMQVEQMGSDYSALDFAFLYVKDLMDAETATEAVTTDHNLPKFNIWSVQDSSRTELIEAVLRPEDLERTAAVICLDIEQPLELMNQLKAWLSGLSKLMFDLIEKMETGQHERMKKKIMQHVQTYEEP